MLPGPEAVLATFVLFCRIGATMMLMPGISSARIPARVRLFFALSVSLALAPLLVPAVLPSVTGADPLSLAVLIVRELMFGALVGLLARVFFLALQSLISVASSAIGFSGMPSVTIDDMEPQPPMVSLIMVSALLLLFQTDQHWEVLRGLAISYAVLPPQAGFDTQLGLIQLADQLTETFLLTLRISSPFIIYSVVVNLAVGITNKLTPQIPVYFIALPFVLLGGLFLLYFSAEEMLRLFMAGFASWILRG